MVLSECRGHRMKQRGQRLHTQNCTTCCQLGDPVTFNKCSYKLYKTKKSTKRHLASKNNKQTNNPAAATKPQGQQQQHNYDERQQQNKQLTAAAATTTTKTPAMTATATTRESHFLSLWLLLGQLTPPTSPSRHPPFLHPPCTL